MYSKQSDEGGVTMCQMLEDMRNETAIRVARETARNTAERLIKYGGMPLEKIALCVPSLSVDELREIAAEMVQ